LRPEQLNVRPAEDGAAIVERVHYFGHDRLLDLVWPGSGLRVHARVPGHLDCETGQRAFNSRSELKAKVGYLS
jgi:hypothetical protein